MGKYLDIFCHWLPEGFEETVSRVTHVPLHMFRRAHAIPVMTDVRMRLKLMEAFSGYQQIPSMASPPLEAMGDAGTTPDLARYANDLMAETAARYPDYFPGFVAALPMNNPEAAVHEAERAITTLGARGVQIFTNVSGKPLDLPEFMPLYERMAELDYPVWLHPARGIHVADYAAESLSQHEIWWSLGWPYETSAAMLRLVFAGVFDRWPGLKVITHHAGGMLPMVEGRLRAGMEGYGTRTSDALKHTVQTALKEKPIDAVRRFYADTASFGSGMTIEIGIKFFKVSHMLFATDMPFGPDQGARLMKETIRLIEELDLSSEEKKQICYGNARQLLRLSEGGTST